MSTTMRRTSTNQFVEVSAERLEGAPVGERRRWSDDFKDRAIAASSGAWRQYFGVGEVAGDLAVTAFRLARRGGETGSQSMRVAGVPSRAARRIGGSRSRLAALCSRAADIAEDDLRRFLRAVRQA